MNSFSIELATSILNLEIQKDKLKNEAITKDRMCGCRVKVLDNYIKLCQQFYIKFIARIIKFHEDKDVEMVLKTNNLERWYYQEMYDKMYTQGCVSNKMLILYRLINNSLDKKFFTYLNDKFYDIITNRISDDAETSDELFTLLDEIYDWMNDHILIIISLKLKCENISNSILNEIQIDEKSCYYKCKDCNVNDIVCTLNENSNEYIHLYLSAETIQYTTEYISIIEKYHTNIKSVDIILDYILFEDYHRFSELDYDLVKVIDGNFKSLKIINFEKVNFGIGYDLVEPYLSTIGE